MAIVFFVLLVEWCKKLFVYATTDSVIDLIPGLAWPDCVILIRILIINGHDKATFSFFFLTFCCCHRIEVFRCFFFFFIFIHFRRASWKYPHIHTRLCRSFLYITFSLCIPLLPCFYMPVLLSISFFGYFLFFFLGVGDFHFSSSILHILSVFFFCQNDNFSLNIKTV